MVTRVCIHKQCVALTGLNTTGSPWSVTDDDRRQRAKQYCPPYTMYRRACNKSIYFMYSCLLRGSVW